MQLQNHYGHEGAWPCKSARRRRHLTPDLRSAKHLALAFAAGPHVANRWSGRSLRHLWGPLSAYQISSSYTATRSKVGDYLIRLTREHLWVDPVYALLEPVPSPTNSPTHQISSSYHEPFRPPVIQKSVMRSILLRIPVRLGVHLVWAEIPHYSIKYKLPT